MSKKKIPEQAAQAAEADPDLNIPDAPESDAIPAAPVKANALSRRGLSVEKKAKAAKRLVLPKDAPEALKRRLKK